MLPDLAVIQFTEAEAREIYESGSWKDVEPKSRAFMQLRQDRLFYPFSQFQSDVETLLGRSVWTHELVQRERLICEAIGEVDPPSVGALFALFLADNVIVVEVPDV